jgi:uncharacterized protein with von Willebrand factor type A (vWA) domain
MFTQAKDIMTRSILPLEELFYRLRDHGLPLGIPEYIAILRAMQAGIGLADSHSLRQLCKALWVKSEEDELLFDRLFDEMLAQPIAPHETETPEVPPKASEEGTSEPAPEAPQTESAPPAENWPSPEISLQTSEPTGIVQAIRYGQHHLDLERPKYSPLNEYFPVTRRQMKQSWRYLRRSVREGPPVELDVEATVQKISREGMFREPVLLPRRSNRAEIVLLIDQDGSMVPFHALSRQLIETVGRGGLLQHTDVYYFHDYPAEYLHLEPARLQAIQVLDVLMGFNAYTAVLVVSDAGAARGHMDRERVQQTGNFLQKLAQHARRFAWVNPLPNPRWANTTAGEIARLVPMFDMSRRGLDDAINTLRGRYVYGEKLYPWMM